MGCLDCGNGQWQVPWNAGSVLIRCSFVVFSSLVSGKCQLGKAFYGDSVLNGHSGVTKHAVDSGVSSSVGLMTESQNHSSGLSGTPAGLKLLHGNSRPDGIPITGDKVHRCVNTVVLLFKILSSYDRFWWFKMMARGWRVGPPPTSPLSPLRRSLPTHSLQFSQ